jgi:hypothetical protein
MPDLADLGVVDTLLGALKHLHGAVPADTDYTGNRHRCRHKAGGQEKQDSIHLSFHLPASKIRFFGEWPNAAYSVFENLTGIR